MTVQNLFSPLRLGPYELKNRIFMAPLTRCRAVEGNLPHPLAPLYYAQRAEAGLIISEASQVTPEGVGYVRTPGIYSAEQVAEWKKVTKAVHEKGGRIFMQLWHTGRISHPDFHGGLPPYSSSASPIGGEIYTPSGVKKPLVTPRAMTLEDIKRTQDYFLQGALNAKEAGFDGVEVHAANGYLFEQFLIDSCNQRTDHYGGPVENRARFLLEVMEGIKKAWGANYLGIRLSPNNRHYSLGDSNPRQTYLYVIEKLQQMGICYLHLIEGLEGSVMSPPPGAERLLADVRKTFRQVLIINGGYDQITGDQVIAEGLADAVSYGVPFISNPDLPTRWQRQLPLREADTSTFYAPGEKGYTDYPLTS